VTSGHVKTAATKVAISAVLSVLILPGDAASAEALAVTTTVRGLPTTTIGSPNELLNAGADAMRRSEYREGIELTLNGLKLVNEPRDVAGGLSNLCAAYAALKEFSLALLACDQALQIDSGNWRTWNNRAAVHLGQGRHDEAIGDVQTGLGIAPNSATLRKTLALIEARKRATQGDDAKFLKA